MDGSSKIELTSMALKVIRGEQEVWLRGDLSKPTPKSTSKKKAPRKARKTRKTKPKYTNEKEKYLFTDSSEEAIFEYLKTFRREFAKHKKTKPFKIFPDKTLLEMASQRPTTLADLESIYGVGPKKMNSFGEIFLNALSEVI